MQLQVRHTQSSVSFRCLGHMMFSPAPQQLTGCQLVAHWEQNVCALLIRCLDPQPPSLRVTHWVQARGFTVRRRDVRSALRPEFVWMLSQLSLAHGLLDGVAGALPRVQLSALRAVTARGTEFRSVRRRLIAVIHVNNHKGDLHPTLPRTLT